MNKKAFTMVELLGVLVILGILSGVSVAAVYKYKEKAQKQAYDTILKSSYEAAEEYIMENSITNSSGSVSLASLVEQGFLEDPLDPATKNVCSGTVSYVLSTANRVTSTGTPVPTSTGTGTSTPTPTGTVSPRPSSTGTGTPRPSSTGTGTPRPSSTGTGTPRPSSTGTGTPTPTGSGTPAGDVVVSKDNLRTYLYTVKLQCGKKSFSATFPK